MRIDIVSAINLKSIVFGVFTISILSSKCVLLRTHFNTISTASFFLYLPTLLLSDLLAISIGRILLSRKSQILALPAFLAVCVTAILVLGGAASQIGFYAETGGNLDWRDAGAYTADYDGLKVLLSGLSTVLLIGNILLVSGAFTGILTYRAAGNILQRIQAEVTSVLRRSLRPRSPPLLTEASKVEDDVESANTSWSQMGSRTIGEFLLDDRDLTSDENLPQGSHRLIITTKIAFIGFILVTLVLRPEKPYYRISVTLPIALLGVLEQQPDACHQQRTVLHNRFPFPHLISSSLWKKPRGDFYRGWAPSIGMWSSPLADAYRDRQIDWIPEENSIHGFLRFGKRSHSVFDSERHDATLCEATDFKEHDFHYNPVNDPLKITNLDTEILPILQNALGDGSVEIKHVVLIVMEGLREEMWPLQKGSHLYETIVKKTHPERRKEVDERLAKLSPHIERLTGSSMGFNKDTTPILPRWTDTAEEGHGGINVVGAYTAATTTLKAFAAIQCGTPVLSVDGFAEADMDAYQPCLPQIFDMFNYANIENSTPVDEFRDRPWKTALFHATSEQYDRLDVFDTKLGYHHRLTRKEIEADALRFNKSDILYQKVNYFAYPEPVIMPYLNKFIDETLVNGDRLFLTHLTSTTHHRWDVPRDYPTVDYMPHAGGWGWRDHLNKYINTVRYHDEWLGDLLHLLDTKGMTNETLVVFVGDHGLSFLEDSGKEGTYENDHLSNLRVGLTFRHPRLPRARYEANMTTISVLPTILDLLLSSGSLNRKTAQIASDLVQDYEGQSLIRPYRKKDGDRRAWAFTVVNPGGRRLTAVSPDAPWKLTMPISSTSEFRFVNAVNDPKEQDALESWVLLDLLELVRKRKGQEAADWVAEAAAMGQWWALERRRLWRYQL